MIITIEEERFDTAAITQLYPAVIVRTGHDEETTQMSLEWYDTEGEGKVEIEGFGIFLHLGEKGQRRFLYPSRAEMEEAIAKLAQQLQGA
jgi:hypothetical protein